jgi:hypothetical protein
LALGTGFTYQGQLKSGSAAVNGACDLAFRLYDDPSTGNQIGSAITQTIPLTGGLFTTALDFGAGAFNGDGRWLDMQVCCPACSGGFTALNQRQALTAAPYALFAAAPWVAGVSNTLSYNAGKVGIGAANPAMALSVIGAIALNDNTRAIWNISANVGQSGGRGVDGNSAFFYNTDNPSFWSGVLVGENADGGFVEAGSQHFGGDWVDQNLLLQNEGGNVGIGTTAPTEKLSVDGIVSTTSGFRFPDGTFQTTAARKGQNVKGVAKSSRDYTTVGAALTSIADNSTANHYLIYVAPGTYTETVTMKPYVDIEGAGELTTKITWVGSVSNTTGTVVGASNVELRFLTVENMGGNTKAIAIYNSSASPRLTHVMATASGAMQIQRIYNDSSSPAMTNVMVSASGASSTNFGVENDSGSSPAITNGMVSASGGTNNYGVYYVVGSATINFSAISAGGGTNNYGIYNFAFTSTNYTVTVNNSLVNGSSNSIYNDSHFTTRVGASQLSGGPVAANGGTLTCAGVYDENYAFFASACP